MNFPKARKQSCKETVAQNCEILYVEIYLVKVFMTPSTSAVTTWPSAIAEVIKNPESKKPALSSLMLKHGSHNVDDIKSLVSLLSPTQSALDENQKKFVTQTVKNWAGFKYLDRETRNTVYTAARQLQLDTSRFPLWLRKTYEFFRSSILWLSGISFEKRKPVLATFLKAEQTVVSGESKSTLDLFQQAIASMNIGRFSPMRRIIHDITLELENIPSKSEHKQTQALESSPKPMERQFLNCPSTKELFELFKGRQSQWSTDIQEMGGVAGYAYTEEQHIEDKKNLAKILTAHNLQMEDKLSLASKETVAGLLEKAEVPEGTEIFVRADLHSDLGSLLAQLELLREEGKLDENYGCRKGFKLIFLGDYMDRGHNDVEVISLLLTLRMENPDSVYLIRGNHENVQIQQLYSEESAWIDENSSLFVDCYKTLPLALFVAEAGGRKEKGGQREYTHFSHGALSAMVDPIGFLEGKESCIAVQKDPEVSKRLTNMACQTASAPKEQRHQQAAAQVLQARQLETKFQHETTSDYTWSDIEESEELIRFNINRLAGTVISPNLIQEYSRTGSEKARVKAFMRGHEHEYKEFKVKRKGPQPQEKVIATTLAVGTVGGAYKDRLTTPQSLQGVFLTVAPRMRDWKKTPVYLTEEASTDMCAKMARGLSVGMYDSLPSNL